MVIASTIHGLWRCHSQSTWRRFIHTPWVGDVVCAWFGRNPSGGRIVVSFTTIVKMEVFCMRGLSANRLACGVAMTKPSKQLSSTYHGWCWMRLVWSKSVGGANSCVIYNHRVNGYTQQSTGLWSRPSRLLNKQHTTINLHHNKCWGSKLTVVDWV